MATLLEDDSIKLLPKNSHINIIVYVCVCVYMSVCIIIYDPEQLVKLAIFIATISR